jgi:hypothetical protein
MKFEFAEQIFEKYSNVKFHGTPSSGNRVAPCGRTDGRTLRKIIVAFRNFAKAPKYKNTHFVPINLFRKLCPLWYNVKNKLTDHRWHMAHVYSMLDDKGYKHSLRISVCSSYCFSPTTIVARTRPDVALYVNCLSCYICYTVLVVTLMSDVLSVVFQRRCSKTNR